MFLPMPMSFYAASLIDISDLPPALHVPVVARMVCCLRNVVVPVVVVAAAVVAAQTVLMKYQTYCLRVPCGRKIKR